MISAQAVHDDGSSDPPEHAASAVRSCREVISLVPLQVRIRRFLGLEDIQGHHVYAPGLSASSLAIDAGANTGAFSTALVRRFGCRVIALEANPILTGGTELPREIDWRNMALAATSGEALFRVSQNPEASSLREDLVLPRDVQSTRMVEVTSLTDLSRREGCGGFDLVKLDIEGAEIDVLMSESDEMLRSIRQIAVEFHSFIAGDQELIAVREVSGRLESLGFSKFSASAPAAHESDVLFLNRRTVALPLRVRLYLALGEPSFSWFRRVLGAARGAIRDQRAPRRRDAKRD